MPFSTKSLATVALFLGGTLGHMIMQSPVPFGVDSLNNSPLVDAKPGSSGSDYPCKLRTGVYDITTMNNMEVGDAQELNFTGSASHGGGTCQIAVTMDEEPDAKSTFKVIQVFEGGCPTGGDGNDGSHPFTFTIPKDFPNGRSTLAWVWYNKIGNREVYMNCAPITVTGGSDSKDVYDSLPNLYLINLPTSECSSVETSDQKIPFPGQYVLEGDSATISAATGPSCAASAAAQTSGVSGYKSATINDGAAYSAPANGGGDKTGAPASSDAQPTSAAGSYASASAPAYGMTTSVSSAVAASSSAPASYPTMTVSSDAGVFGPSSAGTGAAPAPTGGACSGSAVSCSDDGNQFGLCDNGKIVWQKVATGTQCKNGEIMKRSDTRHAHVRRHAQNVGH